MLLSQTDMQSLLIKGLWLQRQRAQSLCCPQNYKKNFQKNREESLHCLLWLSQKTEQEKQKESSMALERKRRRKVARLLGEKGRFLERGRAQKGISILAKAWLLPGHDQFVPLH